jgi:HKD family nuclease
VAVRNPEGSRRAGNWSDPKFLEQIGTPEFNAQIKDTQFADFHSHGWIFARCTSATAMDTCWTRTGRSFPTET